MRVSPDRANALLMSARARVVPEIADDSAEDIWDVGRDGSAERTSCTFGPCNAGFGIVIGDGAAFFKYASDEYRWR